MDVLDLTRACSAGNVVFVGSCVALLSFSQPGWRPSVNNTSCVFLAAKRIVQHSLETTIHHVGRKSKYWSRYPLFAIKLFFTSNGSKITQSISKNDKRDFVNMLNLHVSNSLPETTEENETKATVKPFFIPMFITLQCLRFYFNQMTIKYLRLSHLMLCCFLAVWNNDLPHTFSTLLQYRAVFFFSSFFASATLQHGSTLEHSVMNRHIYPGALWCFWCGCQGCKPMFNSLLSLHGHSNTFLLKPGPDINISPSL